MDLGDKFKISPLDSDIKSPIKLTLAEQKRLYNSLIDADKDNVYAPIQELKFKLYTHIVELD